MNNPNRNRQLPRVAEEANIIASAHQGARRGALVGGLTGAGAGAFLGGKKRKLVGGLAGVTGALAGSSIGRRVGVDRGARDVLAARRALGGQRSQLAALRAEVLDLQQRADNWNFDSIDAATARKPIGGVQDPNPWYPRVRGVGKVGDGLDAEGLAKLTPERQALADEFGWGVVNALPDELLTREHCVALRNEVLKRQDRADQPAAGLRSGEDFERSVLIQHMGSRAVEAMGDAEVHCHFLSAQRRGLIELDDTDATTDFALINRVRNDEGEFTEENAVSSQAVQKTYSPQRRTGRDIGVGAGAAATAAGLAGAIAHARKLRRAKLPRLGNGTPPTLPGADFAARHMKPSPFPGGPVKLVRRPKRSGKLLPKKRNNFAFMIHDPDFPIMPVKRPKFPIGSLVRVKPAETRQQAIARLKAITQLGIGDLAGALVPEEAVPFAAGKAVVEGALDMMGLGNLAGETPAQRRARQARIAQQQQNAADDSNIANDSTAQPRTLDSALGRLASMDFAIGDAIARGAARFAPEVAAIAGGDILAESLHDRLVERAQKRKKQKALLKGGIQAQSPAGPTTMSAILGTLNEFSDSSRDRAKRRAGELGAAGTGAVGGALAGAYHDQGKPVRVRDLRPGDQVYRRQGPGGLHQHTGVVDETGERIVHRTPGSSVSRSVKPENFLKGGRGPLRRETHSDDLPRSQAARNASAAAGTRQGKYSIVGENCQHASSRIASKGAPGSRQLRKVVSGALLGGAAAGTMAHVLNNRKKGNK